MEKKQTINEYIATEMGGKIEKKKDFPLVGLTLLIGGAIALVLMAGIHDADSLQTLLLTVGIISIAVGLVLTAMALSGSMWHYRYIATGSRMQDGKVYLSIDDYQTAVEALVSKDHGSLSHLKAVVSSNCALRVLRSKDGSIALVQAGRYDTGHFEEETPVVCLVGTEVAAIEALCR